MFLISVSKNSQKEEKERFLELIKITEELEELSSQYMSGKLNWDQYKKKTDDEKYRVNLRRLAAVIAQSK